MIVGFSDGNIQQLRTFTHVSPHFHFPASNLLHKKVTLGPPSKREPCHMARTSTELYGVICGRPEIRQYIEDTTSTDHGPLYTWLDKSAAHWLEFDETLQKIFPLLPILHRLAITGSESGKLGYNRLSYNKFSPSLHRAFDTLYPRLTSLKLVHVTDIPIDILCDLPPTLTEFILHEPSWDFSGLSRFYKVRQKACQLAGTGISHLQEVHLDLTKSTDHSCSWELLEYTRKTLRHLEFTPSDSVITGTAREDIQFDEFERLESVSVTLPVVLYHEPEMFDHMADN
ncbi:hypothetical protein NP233_g8096 [Leucocoprinus birnbaumii]|uniref:Uncharacterized protein n=1 Tax=Leucocoprinus birnbaumii TaxID=56174 RepID=A0AAD5VMX4_9AGAR|nr:hypothetical protein NP233_g8096 [Leucocoprinus birnbaumii]